jgi:hypothetical protein
VGVAEMLGLWREAVDDRLDGRRGLPMGWAAAGCEVGLSGDEAWRDGRCWRERRGGEWESMLGKARWSALQVWERCKRDEDTR